MTKKDYESAARIVQTFDSSRDARAARTAFITLFQRDNPRFDSNRFLAACGVEAMAGKVQKSRKARNMVGGRTVDPMSSDRGVLK